MRRIALLAALVALGVSCPLPAAAQVTTPDLSREESALRVFLDCATWRCREDRFRQEITWVNWVREPQDAQVYVLLTGQSAGSGGFQYAFDFEGQGPLEGLEDRYLFTSSGTDVEEEVVAGLTQTIGLGLVRFAARAGFTDMLAVTGVERDLPSTEELEEEQEEDPWNYWVFSLRGNADLEREDRETQDEFRFSASANRTTDMWKIDLGGSFNLSRREVEFDDGDSFVDERDDWDARTLVVRSLDSHWSTGLRAQAGSSTRFNRDFGFDLAPAIEWNYFPWQESTRRRLVALYTLGIEYREYEEITVFEKLSELLWRHQFDLQFRQQESWGSANFGVEARQYLQHSDEYQVQLTGNVNYRLIRGLGLDLRANYEIIHDQRYLSGAGLTPEEILTRRRALATGSRLSFEVGISYRFGSIFNNIVNARFPALGGGGGGRF
ncbi:MAG: hypothetical protein JSU98_01355 [Gemmatimonadales bacterium]|jgi:hypothetical protein|nr:MAG: hypothetical protein JSU98_01355 [Gemmatimonadales bacterium]